jgi:sulfofructose kinase
MSACNRSTSSFDVVGLGVSPLDILALVEHYPIGEEVQPAFQITLQGGGPVATAMATLGKLGVRTAMLDAIGDDWQGKLILEDFKEALVCTDYIKTCTGHSSASAMILVRKDTGERAIYHLPGSAPELSPSELPKDVISSVKYLHVNGRHWQACLAAVSIARQANVLISFDGGAGRFRHEFRQLVPLVDVCIVAQDFAQAYTGIEGIDEAAQSFLREGPRIVVLTAGMQGSWVFDRSGMKIHQPAFFVSPVVDTTGCGDSYHGAFLFGMLQGFSLPETTAFASAVAALNSQKLGGRAALPTYKDVIAFLQSKNSIEIIHNLSTEHKT